MNSVALWIKHHDNVARERLLIYLKGISHEFKWSVFNFYNTINRLIKRRWLKFSVVKAKEFKLKTFSSFWAVVNYSSSHFWRVFAQLIWLSLCNHSGPRLFVTQLVDKSADRLGITILPRWGHVENSFGQAIKSNTGGTALTLLSSHAGQLKSSIFFLDFLS